MIIARATLAGQTYELHREHDNPAEPASPLWWQRGNVELDAPASTSASLTVDALWDYVGCELEVEGWWQPVVDGLDISAAKRPVTVAEQELILGDALSDELHKVGGLGLETDAGTAPTRAHRALAHRQLRAHYEQVIAEQLLEQVALAHDLECELVAEAGATSWLVIGPDWVEGDDPLATGAGPLTAVLELQRSLHRRAIGEALNRWRASYL
jgi:hypothetical protein